MLYPQDARMGKHPALRMIKPLRVRADIYGGLFRTWWKIIILLIRPGKILIRPGRLAIPPGRITAYYARADYYSARADYNSAQAE